MNISTAQLIQLLVFAGLVVLPALAKVFEHVQKQRVRKSQEDMVERAAHEALRTGRDPNEVIADLRVATAQAEAQPAQRRSQTNEIEARRRAQLEELRRRAQARRQAATSGASSGPGGATMTPGRGATVAAPPRRPGTAPQPTRRPTPTAPARPTQPRPITGAIRPPARPGMATQRRRSEPVPTPAMVQPEFERTSRLLEDRPGYAPARVERPSSAEADAIRAMAPTDWRRAIIMREILDQPVALRSGGPW